mmetsp:Transcript_47504/g.150584  ORF Transcript_47504/g.150584 Transcript_47504/m.150584 type:complete len:265 (-) Transcript_47504:710-1504(-)
MERYHPRSTSPRRASGRAKLSTKRPHAAHVARRGVLERAPHAHTSSHTKEADVNLDLAPLSRRPTRAHTTPRRAHQTRPECTGALLLARARGPRRPQPAHGDAGGHALLLPARWAPSKAARSGGTIRSSECRKPRVGFALSTPLSPAAATASPPSGPDAAAPLVSGAAASSLAGAGATAAALPPQPRAARSRGPLSRSREAQRARMRDDAAAKCSATSASKGGAELRSVVVIDLSERSKAPSLYRRAWCAPSEVPSCRSYPASL